MTRPEVGAMHASWLDGLSYEWLGYARPLSPGLGVGSISVAYFHMPSIAGYDEYDNPTGEYKVHDMAVTAGLSHAFSRAFSAGANVRYIQQTLADVSGSGVAVDLGLKGVLAGTTLGASVQNLGPDISLGGSSYPIPRQVRLGASRGFAADRLLLAADYNIPRDYFKDVRLGAEVRPHQILALRLGYRHEFGSPDDPQNGLSFGVGLRWKQLLVDYSMTPDNAFDDVQRLSFGYSFGGGEQKAPQPKAPPREEKPEPPAAPTGPKVIARATPPAPAAQAPQATAQAAPKTAAPTAPPTQTAAGAPGAAAPAPRAVAQAAPAPAPKTQAAPAAPKPAAKTTVYDVVLGTFQSEDAARSELKALEILGFQVKDAKIAAAAGGGYRLSLARFGSRKSADQLASSLAKMSFQPRVELVQR
jgi:hypothetical protein